MKDVQFKDLQGGDIFFLYGHQYEKLYGNKCRDRLGSIIICDPDNWVQVKL